MPETYPRPLDERERAALEHLLSADFPGRQALLRQAEVTVVAAICGCGCATINFGVDRARSERAENDHYMAVDALARGEPPCEVLLFLEDGWLFSLELVWYDQPIGTFPSPDRLERPTPR